MKVFMSIKNIMRVLLLLVSTTFPSSFIRQASRGNIEMLAVYAQA